MPNALHAWNLDNSQIEDVERPKKELQDLLSLAQHHEGHKEDVGAAAKPMRSNHKCCIV